MMIIRYGDNERDYGEMPIPLRGFEHINRYWDQRHDIFAAKIKPGEYYVSVHGEMIATVLGSCVSACVRDPVSGIGGMNHFMLPDNTTHRSGSWANTPVNTEARYGNIAMERLINVIIANGGIRKNLEMKVFGGGKVLNLTTDIGGNNINFVKQYINKEGFNIESEDVGGVYPRKVQYFPLSGRVRVKRLYRMHNETLIKREAEYIDSLKHEKLAGKVDLFK
jgi:chemotaxis protein CheD